MLKIVQYIHLMESEKLYQEFMINKKNPILPSPEQVALLGKN